MNTPIHKLATLHRGASRQHASRWTLAIHISRHSFQADVNNWQIDLYLSRPQCLVSRGKCKATLSTVFSALEAGLSAVFELPGGWGGLNPPPSPCPPPYP